MKLLSSFSLLSKVSARNSSSKFNPSDWHIVSLKNDIIAAWHPKKQHPYEYTQPIDLQAVAKEKKAIEELRGADNYQRRQSSPYKIDGPDNLTLRNIFNVGQTEFSSRTREDRLYDTAAPIPKRK